MPHYHKTPDFPICFRGSTVTYDFLFHQIASPKNETNYGCAPIWFAASEGHNNVLKYLMHKEHDTYALMEDKRFVYNLMVVSKNNNHKPIEEFILVSPAPVDAAAKLSNIYMILSTKVRRRSKKWHNFIAK